MREVLLKILQKKMFRLVLHNLKKKEISLNVILDLKHWSLDSLAPSLMYDSILGSGFVSEAVKTPWWKRNKLKPKRRSWKLHVDTQRKSWRSLERVILEETRVGCFVGKE